MWSGKLEERGCSVQGREKIAFAEGQVIEDEAVDTSGGAFDENDSVRRRIKSVPKSWQPKDSEEEWSEMVVANSFSR